MANRRSKRWKTALKLEGARLSKAFKEVGEWTDELIEGAEALANKWLGHGQGSRDDELKSEPFYWETPVGGGREITLLSPAVYMQPC